MASGGPIFPFSAVPDSSGLAFPNVHSGDGGGGSILEMGLGVADLTSETVDVVWHLRFLMPPDLPDETCKLRLIGLCDQAATTSAYVNPKWASVAIEEDPSAASLTAEGTTECEWTTEDDDQYKKWDITLDADTVVANEIIVMALTFEYTNWDLADVSTWQASIVWES